MSESTPPTSLISVIMPAYNAEAFIGQAVSSALVSRDVDLEVIVVDDGSTDETWSILERFGDAVRKVRQEWGGACRARNLAAGLAQGAWLAFLDADEVWVPEKLASQLSAAEDGTDLVYTDRLNLDDIERDKERQSDSVTLREGDILQPLLLGKFVTHSSVLMRRDWFNSLGGFSTHHLGAEDWKLWLRHAAAGGLTKLCREPLTRYRIPFSTDDQRSEDPRPGSRGGDSPGAGDAPGETSLPICGAAGLVQFLADRGLAVPGRQPRGVLGRLLPSRLLLAVEPSTLQGDA